MQRISFRNAFRGLYGVIAHVSLDCILFYLSAKVLQNFVNLVISKVYLFKVKWE